FRMFRPEAFAHVRKFKPCIDLDGVSMAGVDHAAEVIVGLGVALPIVPSGDVQSTYPGGSPTWREGVKVHARPIRAVEGRPEFRRVERRIKPELRKCMSDI